MVPTVPDSVVMRSGAWATGVVWLTRKIGSLENVMVTVPFAAAVPTATRPVEVSRSCHRPQCWRSVIVIVIGAVAVGDVPLGASQVTAKEST